MMLLLDILGAGFSILATYFFVTTNLWAWPVGVVATLLNASLYFQSGIYGDGTLELIYCVTMFYGWYQWGRGEEGMGELSISNLSLSLGLTLGVIALAGSGLLYFILTHYTPSQFPIQDAITTIFSLIAQYLLCRKIIETWVVWFVVDALYIEMYFNKGLPFHSVLLAVYLGMAVYGYVAWREKQGTGSADSIWLRN